MRGVRCMQRSCDRVQCNEQRGPIGENLRFNRKSQQRGLRSMHICVVAVFNIHVDTKFIAQERYCLRCMCMCLYSLNHVPIFYQTIVFVSNKSP